MRRHCEDFTKLVGGYWPVPGGGDIVFSNVQQKSYSHAIDFSVISYISLESCVWRECKAMHRRAPKLHTSGCAQTM